MAYDPFLESNNCNRVCRKLKFIKILGKGNYWQECLVLEVLQDCNIGMHVVIKATFSDSSEEYLNCRDVYWFSQQNAKEGDLIWLYSCTGNDGVLIENSKITIHTLFWGLPAAIWSNGADVVVLAEATDVFGKTVETL